MSLLCCAYLSLSDPIAYGYDVMMLNVLRSCITIKNVTYHRGLNLKFVAFPGANQNMRVNIVRFSAFPFSFTSLKFPKF